MADWFKIYENDLDEMRLQWAIGEMPEVLNVWIVLLSEACRHKDGTLSGYKEDFELFGISKRINVTVPIVNSSIELLVKIGYLKRLPDGSLIIRKWSEKQSEYCQKKTKLQNQFGKDNPNHSTKRTKNRDIVGIVSGQSPESVVQEERRGEEIREDKNAFNSNDIELPEALQTERFKAAWMDWIPFRRGVSKIKDPKGFFQNQINDLSGWGEEDAFTAIKSSLLNGYRGLFKPKGQKSHQNGSKPKPVLRPSFDDVKKEEKV